MTNDDINGRLYVHLVSAGGAVGLLADGVLHHIEPSALSPDVYAMFQELVATLRDDSARLMSLALTLKKKINQDDTPPPEM